MDLTNTVVLDTETTGLDKAAEVCEISLVDGRTGLVLLDTLVKPTRPISPGAAKVHGIDDAMVAEAPSWADLHDLIIRLLSGVTVVIYQQDFDLRLMRQSAKAVDRRLPPLDSECAMLWLFDYLKTRTNPNPKWPKLTEAAEAFGVTPQGTAHRALCDARMTRDVLLAAREDDQRNYLYRDAPEMAPQPEDSNDG